MNIAVVGGSNCTKKVYATARRLGALIAREGWTLVCGGGGGVMEAACRGVHEAGGVSIGLLPGSDAQEANTYLTASLPTGIGYARNMLVVRAAEIVVALPGEYGTLSEISFALNEGKTVVGIDTWGIKGVIPVAGPEEAVSIVKKKAAL